MISSLVGVHWCWLHHWLHVGHPPSSGLGTQSLGLSEEPFSAFDERGSGIGQKLTSLSRCKQNVQLSTNHRPRGGSHPCLLDCQALAPNSVLHVPLLFDSSLYM